MFRVAREEYIAQNPTRVVNRSIFIVECLLMGRWEWEDGKGCCWRFSGQLLIDWRQAGGVGLGIAMGSDWSLFWKLDFELMIDYGVRVLGFSLVGFVLLKMIEI